MGTVFRCCLAITVLAIWLIFTFSAVEASLSSRRNGGGQNRLDYFQWDLENELSETPYSECDESSLVGKVTKVEVVGCTNDPCELKAGSIATVKLGFVHHVNVETFIAKVYRVIGGIPVPFHVPHPNGCADSGVKCPLVAGTEYSYFNTIPVLKNYPRINVKVKWELVTGDVKTLVCVLIPANIVS